MELFVACPHLLPFRQMCLCLSDRVVKPHVPKHTPVQNVLGGEEGFEGLHSVTVLAISHGGEPSQVNGTTMHTCPLGLSAANPTSLEIALWPQGGYIRFSIICRLSGSHGKIATHPSPALNCMKLCGLQHLCLLLQKARDKGSTTQSQEPSGDKNFRLVTPPCPVEPPQPPNN